MQRADTLLLSVFTSTFNLFVFRSGLPASECIQEMATCTEPSSYCGCLLDVIIWFTDGVNLNLHDILCVHKNVKSFCSISWDNWFLGHFFPYLHITCLCHLFPSQRCFQVWNVKCQTHVSCLTGSEIQLTSNKVIMIVIIKISCVDLYRFSATILCTFITLPISQGLVVLR